MKSDVPRGRKVEPERELHPHEWKQGEEKERRERLGESRIPGYSRRRMSDATQETLEAVIAVARDAGAIQLARRGERLAEVEKDGGGSFATAVDYACEKVILDALRPRFPHHRFIAEESGVAGAEDAEYTWAIDPLDGTTAYVSGQPYFAVSIGLVHHGEPVLGVIHLPQFGRMYSAIRGSGAFRDGTRIQVS